jgi:hypothetical protein
MAAFAMTLPALAEQQLACLKRYGAEHCEEFLVKTTDPTVTIFAGVLRHRFANKKSAQCAFGLNLKAWGIDRGNKASRGWYRELSVDEYVVEFHDVPGTSGRRRYAQVWDILNKCNATALQNVAKALAEKEKTEAEALQKERYAKMRAEIEEKRAARFALDPEGNAEKERVAREKTAMRQEGRCAERIRHAENLAPPGKRRRELSFIDDNQKAASQVARAVSARAKLEAEIDKHKATFGDANPDGLELLKEKEKKLKNDYEWAWRERIDAEIELHKATFGCNGGNRQSDREVLAALQMRKQHMMNGLF